MRKLKDSGIYMIKNIKNNKVYIGSSIHVYKRRRSHYSKLRKNEHYNRYLQFSWNKYKEENFKFETIQLNIKKEHLHLMERYYIRKYRSLDKKYGYNLCFPNTCGISGFTEHSKELLRKRVYERKYGQTSIEEYEKWKQGLIDKKNKPKLTIKDKILLAKNRNRCFVIDSKTNNKVYEFNSQGEAARFFKTSQDVIRRVKNTTKTIRGYHIIEEKLYDSDKDYRKKNKPKPFKKGRFKGNPLELTNIETNEVVICKNKYEAIEKYNMTQKGIYKATCGQRKSHKGYKIKIMSL